VDIGPLIRSHVERCLQEEFELCRVVSDGDGDYPFEHESIVYYVGLVECGGEWWIRVFCPLVFGVKRSAKLLAELNDLNTRTPLTRAVWADGTVYVDGVLHASAVNRDSLGRLCHAVAHVSADMGDMIALVYGGLRTSAPSRDEETA